MSALLKTAPPNDGDIFQQIIQDLETQGYSINCDLWPQENVQAIFQHIKALDEKEFDAAGIGRESNYQINQFVRTDKICWLNNRDPDLESYFSRLEALRLAINYTLFLGLFDYECLYAYYPVGAYYKKHMDAFLGQSNRKLTCILYLNPGWSTDDGGELLLYAENSNEILETIQPTFGKMVIFLSEKFPHEVKETRRNRFSLTGWFRINDVGLI